MDEVIQTKIQKKRTLRIACRKLFAYVCGRYTNASVACSKLFADVAGTQTLLLLAVPGKLFAYVAGTQNAGQGRRREFEPSQGTFSLCKTDGLFRGKKKTVNLVWPTCDPSVLRRDTSKNAKNTTSVIKPITLITLNLSPDLTRKTLEKIRRFFFFLERNGRPH